MDARIEVQSQEQTVSQPAQRPPDRRGRWKRYAWRTTAALLVLLAVVAFLAKDHIRTLQSLRHIPGTNAYVMDYYVDYNIDEIREQGMDVVNVENGLINVFFPDPVSAIAMAVKERFLD